MECHDFLKIADSYLSGELSVESNHGVICHLEHCGKCRHELSTRRLLRTKLREAFINFPENSVRPQFVTDLSTQLRSATIKAHSVSPAVHRSSPLVKRERLQWLAVAACLLVTLLTGLLLFKAQNWWPSQNQEQANSQQLNVLKTELAVAAVGDHRDCAVHFRLAEKPIALELAGEKYDPVYLNLTRAILTEEGVAPLGSQVIEAHSCVFEGRRFAHVVLRYHSSVVSFLVTNLSNTVGAGNGSALSMRADPIVCAQMEGYKVSCFHTARHAIFVVSNLSEGENLALTRALAPRVFEHIVNSERIG